MQIQWYQRQIKKKSGHQFMYYIVFPIAETQFVNDLLFMCSFQLDVNKNI